MIYPSINKLMESFDSRYSLVIAASKRARELGEEKSMPLVNINTDKTVTIAVHELEEQLLTITSLIHEEKEEIETNEPMTAHTL